MDRQAEKVELFRAFDVEEIEARLQDGKGSGLGDYWYGCSYFFFD